MKFTTWGVNFMCRGSLYFGTFHVALSISECVVVCDQGQQWTWVVLYYKRAAFEATKYQSSRVAFKSLLQLENIESFMVLRSGSHGKLANHYLILIWVAGTTEIPVWGAAIFWQRWFRRKFTDNRTLSRCWHHQATHSWSTHFSRSRTGLWRRLYKKLG